MTNITITPIKENGKTVAYVIPAQEYEDLKFMVKEEDKHLSFMADEAMKEGLVTSDKAEELNNKANKLWNLHIQN